MDEVIAAGSSAAADEENALQQRQIIDHLLQLQHLQSPSVSNLLLPNIHWQRLKPELNGSAVAGDDTAELLNKIGPIVTAALLGFQAIPIRLKILLERIFQDLSPLNVEILLSKAGWTTADFARGYLLHEKSEALANSSVWVCASLYSELNLLHVVSIMLPAYAQLAESMRQTAIHSLVYTAVLVQQQQQQQQEVIQQQTNNSTDMQQPTRHVAKLEESATQSSLIGVAEDQADNDQKPPIATYTKVIL
uniref:Uncharacterized protein n=1 Tax=Ditylenchus dipsaci TaxID=166011 RepID=A0A915D128_9BILA